MEGRSVTGVAKLDDKIFVASDEYFTLYVFEDSYPFGLLKNVKFPDVTLARDIVACDINHCLYLSVADEEGSLWRVTVDCEETKIFDGPLYGSGTLSVTGNGEILMLTLSELLILSPSGCIVCRVPLPTDIVQPQHATAMPSGNVLISQGLSPDFLHRICEVSSSGQILRSFGGSRGDGAESLNKPYYIVHDDVGDNVFVADGDNGRVLLLDAQLRLKRVLLSMDADGIAQPYRLRYIRDTRHLIVTQVNGDVSIYIIKCLS